MVFAMPWYEDLDQKCRDYLPDLRMESGVPMGVEIINRPVATVENGFVRHDPGHLARELILLHAERSVHIAGDRFGEGSYRVERKK